MMKRILCIQLLGLSRGSARNGPENLSQNDLCRAEPAGEIEASQRGTPGSGYAAARDTLPAVARWCDQFSPLVAAAPPDCLLLDITGSEHLFGGDRLLAERILRELGRRGIDARIAVADTQGAAWALVNAEWPTENGITPGCARPLGDPSEFRIPTSEFIIVVPPGETVRALRALPVETLRLPGNIVDLLRQLGIRQIGQLAGLPRAELTTRLGPDLVRRLDQAYGQVDEPLPIAAPRPALAARELIEYPSTRRENIEAVLARLIERVAGTLHQHGLGALRLECQLECFPSPPLKLSVGLFQPTASAARLLGLLEIQLERAAIPGPVSAVHLEVTMAAPWLWRQSDLFSDVPPRRQPQHLAALVERLSSRLGHRAVTRPRRVTDAQPELACTCDPLVESGKRRRAVGRNVPGDLPLRPLRLLPRPLLLAALAVSPGGPPLRFHFRNCEHRIARTWGPERIETGWWRGRAVGRDYYRAETNTGQRFWLFRRLADGKWFLHGMFE